MPKADPLSEFVSIRLPADVIATIDEIKDRERRRARSDTIRTLIDEALDARKDKRRRPEYAAK